MILKEVPVTETVYEKSYFLALRQWKSITYRSQMKNGKTRWTSKLGIAIHYHGGPQLVSLFASNPGLDLLAYEVPADHAKRWRARK